MRASQTMLLLALKRPMLEVARRLESESMRGLRVYNVYTHCTAASTQGSHERNWRFRVTLAYVIPMDEQGMHDLIGRSLFAIATESYLIAANKRACPPPFRRLL